MKDIYITGSIAYDHIMTFDGIFKDSLLPSHFEHISVSFLAKTHEVNFGGCAANIGYSLRLLGHTPYVCGVAGNDFAKYFDWFKKNGIPTKNIVIDEKMPTAAAYIISDQENNQVAIFSPGAMNDLQRAAYLKDWKPQEIGCVVIAPGAPHRMLEVAQFCIENNIPYLFDPGQSIPILASEALVTIIENSKGIIFNEYESELLLKKVGIPLKDLTRKTEFVVKTLSEKGCELYTKEGTKIIPAILNLNVADVTGSGDGFRAGFLHGYINGESLERSCEMGNTLASFVLENIGTQCHSFSKDEFTARLLKHYGEGV